MSEKLDIGILSREKLFTKLIQHFSFVHLQKIINKLGSLTLNDDALIFWMWFETWNTVFRYISQVNENK